MEELKARIKVAAARRAPELASRNSLIKPPKLPRSSQVEFDLPDVNLNPGFQTHRNGHYHVNDLVRFHDRDFVRNAYRAILRREPSPEESEHCLESLRDGRKNKIDILAGLRFSAEGRQKSVTVEGLRLPALIRSVAHFPIVGYVWQWLIGLLRLPVATVNQRKFESYVITQQQALADHLNRLTHTVRGFEQFFDDLVFQQQGFEQRLAPAEETMLRQGERLRAHDEVFADLSKQTEALRRRNDNLDAQLVSGQEKLAAQTESLEALRAQFQQLRIELSIQESQLRAAFHPSVQKEIAAPESGIKPYASVQHHASDAFFVSFEDRFRGQEADIRARLAFYLPYLENANIKSRVLDVGCGRGEWLVLLQEKGIDAQGVEANDLLVQRCQAAGLTVQHADALDHLRALPEGSLDAVTAFHVIEHLEFADLIDLVDLSLRVLRPGGLLILESPNPENVIVATRNFYLDPSHLHPLPSELIEFLLKTRGFKDAEVVNLHPLTEARVPGDTEISHRFNDLFYGPMDYGVIATR